MNVFILQCLLAKFTCFSQFLNILIHFFQLLLRGLLSSQMLEFVILVRVFRLQEVSELQRASKLVFNSRKEEVLRIVHAPRKVILTRFGLSEEGILLEFELFAS
ncbi:unnamed protein product [Ixodes persulcatus]